MSSLWCLSYSLIKFNKYKHNKSKWITQGLLKSIRSRDKLYARLKRLQPNTIEHNTLLINLKTYNNILKRSIRTAKTLYFEITFQKFKYDIRNTWKTLNDILSRNKTKDPLPTKLRDNINAIDITNKSDIANTLNNFFTSIGRNLAHNINYTGDKNHRYYLKTNHEKVFKFKEIEQESITMVINSLTNKSSVGIDGISTILLKCIAPSIIKPLTLIINQIMKTGVFPNKMKFAKVIPIYKKDDPTQVTNYRPISLLPVLSKVVEKTIAKQLSEYFEENKLFNQNQYGFRTGHSTEHAALELVDKITSQMDNNETPINIFLDLSKAFDTIDHNILLDKLKYYGLDDTAIKLFRSYLTNRYQYVQMENAKSQILEINTGVPQGSILGPLLFIIYINDISQSSDKFDFLAYADDTTLSTTLNKFSTSDDMNISDLINLELYKINEWLEINKLSLNANKSRFMIFHMPNKQITLPILQICNTNIEKVNEFNFLGLTLDTRLDWKRHSNNTSNKISRTIGVLNKLKNVLPQHIKTIIYNTLILPHLNYCILCWGFKSNRVFALQKKAVRIITCSKYNAHTEPLFKTVKLLKFTDLLKLRELYFYYKFIHGLLPIPLQNWHIIRNTNIHEHNTRRQSNLHIYRTQHTFARHCLRHDLPNTLNNTCELVKGKIYTHSLSGFTNYAKHQIIQNYELTCNITRCYICSHDVR